MTMVKGNKKRVISFAAITNKREEGGLGEKSYRPHRRRCIRVSDILF